MFSKDNKPEKFKDAETIIGASVKVKGNFQGQGNIIIEGALEGLVRDLGPKVVKKVLAAIDQTVEGFLNEALQISPQQISVQLKAEGLGYL